MQKEFINELIKQANNGVEKAQMTLAELYFKGIDGKVDYNESIKYLKMASKTNQYAVLQIANMYDNGIGVLPNNKESFKILKDAADKQSNPIAMVQVGRRLIDGFGVDKNYEEGIDYLIKADELKNQEAPYLLGYYYQQDNKLEEARTYYLKAIDYKHPQSAYNIGFMYYNGAFGEQDLIEALKYFRIALNLGLPSKDLVEKVEKEIPYNLSYTQVL